MIPLTLDEVLSPLGARVSRGSQSRLALRSPTGVSIDSRTIGQGECFCALAGPRFDGHDFILQAIQRGAGWIIHAPTWSPRSLGSQADAAVFLEVEHTDRALRQLAGYLRRKWGGPVVAITGSMGKTTTRNFAARLLALQHCLLEAEGNLNNEIGVPLSLLRLEPSHRLAVLELGMNRAGEIGRLAALCAPDVAVITNVAPVHLEFFKNVQEIAAAKGEILSHLSPDGLLVFNADDPLVAALAASTPHRKISFGLTPEAAVVVQEVRIESLESMSFTLGFEGRQVRTKVAFAGHHFLYDVAAAVAVACHYRIPLEKLAAELGQLRPGPQRGRVLQVPGGSTGEITIWDDSYNSNPGAVRSVLETLSLLQGYRRKILVLGEMRELGAASGELHYETGQAAARSGANLLCVVGAGAGPVAEGARAAGMPPDQVLYFPDSDAAAQAVAEQAQGGDLVLCKASRGVQIERVVRRLTRQAGACEA